MGKILLFELSRKGGICPILARNTIGFLMVFRATTNNTGENGDKKQNTLPYPYNFKVVEVCLVGAGDESRTRREQLGKLPPYR